MWLKLINRPMNLVPSRPHSPVSSVSPQQTIVTVDLSVHHLLFIQLESESQGELDLIPVEPR